MSDADLPPSWQADRLIRDAMYAGDTEFHDDVHRLRSELDLAILNRTAAVRYGPIDLDNDLPEDQRVRIFHASGAECPNRIGCPWPRHFLHLVDEGDSSESADADNNEAPTAPPATAHPDQPSPITGDQTGPGPGAHPGASTTVPVLDGGDQTTRVGFLTLSSEAAAIVTHPNLDIRLGSGYVRRPDGSRDMLAAYLIAEPVKAQKFDESRPQAPSHRTVDLVQTVDSDGATITTLPDGPSAIDPRDTRSISTSIRDRVDEVLHRMFHAATSRCVTRREADAIRAAGGLPVVTCLWGEFDDRAAQLIDLLREAGLVITTRQEPVTSEPPAA